MKKLTTLVVLALMLGALVAGLAIFGGGSAQASQPIHVVNDDAGGKLSEPAPCDVAPDETTIGAAVTAATAGDKILVCPGTYNENVVVVKALVLRGVGATQPVVDAGGTGSAIKITVDGVTVHNFETRNAGVTMGASSDAGIRVESNNNTITGNTSTENGRAGIFVNGGDNNLIQGNNLIANLICGIVLRDSDDNDVSLNDISLNGSSGIRVQNGSDGNAIHHNTIHNNTGGSSDGINVRSGPDNIIYSNTSTNNTRDGIRLQPGADANQVLANDVGDNGFDGILILGNDNVIEFNTAINNAGVGVNNDKDGKRNKCDRNTAAANGNDFIRCS